MKREDRKAAIAAYKERKAPGGVFAVRCATTGAAWVGSNTDLEKIQNRIWFALRQGGSPHRSLQRAWNEEGGDAISFEVLERLPDDVSDIARGRMLSERAEHWRAELDAEAI